MCVEIICIQIVYKMPLGLCINVPKGRIVIFDRTIPIKNKGQKPTTSQVNVCILVACVLRMGKWLVEGLSM